MPALRVLTVTANTSTAAESAVVIARAMNAEALLKEQTLGAGKLNRHT